MAVICTAATGTQTKITLASIFLSALLYGGALFVLMELVGLMLRTFQRDTPAFASRPSPVSRPPGAPRRFASFFPRTDTAKSASATLITTHRSEEHTSELQSLMRISSAV